MSFHLHAINLHEELTKFIASSFGLSGKMPGTINAQKRVLNYIHDFIVRNNLGEDYTTDLFSPSDSPFICRIVTTVYKNKEVLFTSSIDFELKDILEKEIDTVNVPIEEPVIEENTTKPTEHKAVVISTPEEQPVVTKNEDKENDMVQEIHEDPEESVSVETESEVVYTPISEKDHYQEVVDTILSDEQETSEERHSENMINIQYPHEVIVAIGKFVNSVNLFNIGNMVFGETITVAQTNTISEQIFEIMGHSDIIREHIPELICDIGSSMDYRRGVFSIDVHVVLDITIQKLTSDYVMSFKVVRK